MRSKLAWLLVPLFGVALWIVLHGRGGTAAPTTPSALPVTSARDATPSPPAQPAATSPAPVQPSVPVPQPSTTAAPTQVAAGGPSGAGVAPGAARPASGAQGSVSAPPVGASATTPPPVDPDAPAGKFTDRTGWADGSVAKQLNKEFMPLASECIAQAQARNPKLDGMLGYAVVIAPTESGKVIVSSLKPLPTNQITDPELFECIRESSFALEGLTAPHDFSITMPVHPDGRD